LALTAFKGDNTLAELAQEFDLHANQVVERKQQMQEHAVEVFGRVLPIGNQPNRTSECSR